MPFMLIFFLFSDEIHGEIIDREQDLVPAHERVCERLVVLSKP